ncbi:MAG: sigma 54-interacting transcriptional regulator [Pyrinomonadaceae bacterium]|nr:sigma 54-interacting transcriptional regulator [Pyrinomonadaceae bacterium]
MANPRGKRRISDESVARILSSVRENLAEGLSGKAEEELTETLETYALSPENEGLVTGLLSYALETLGRYDRALSVIDKYDSEEELAELTPETQILIINQLAIALSNSGDNPKAVALLNYSLEKTQEEGLTSYLGQIFVSLARVYRKLSEYPIARDHARQGLAQYREQGDWRGMADAYHTIAMTYHQEGDSKEALENFQLAIKIIGDRTAPFLLGKLYSDMSGAYWFHREPHEGIACLEKSIEFFSKTEHKVQTVAAYNNLGMNLMILGNWARAEEMIQHALTIAQEVDHAHIAGILDSLGELNLLRGNIKEAKEYVTEGIKTAKERKKDWYAIQAMRTLGRVHLAAKEFEEAIKTSRETIAICEEMGESHYASMTGLVLAEALLETGKRKEYKKVIEDIEETDPSSDFFVLGMLQKIRGKAAELSGDTENAVHHYSRALTIFESSDDLYHIALAHLHLGKALSSTDTRKSSKHLVTSSEIFRKLGVGSLHEEAERTIENLGDEDGQDVIKTASSQLLMQRLAEATASRELLFRELTSILQAESKARRIIIAETGEKTRYTPFITHGYTPAECSDVIDALNESVKKDDFETFSKIRNIAVFSLKTASAPPAVLLMFPASGAKLKNGNKIQPLLRVVELGMDVCALRDQDRISKSDEAASPFKSQSLMPGFIHSSAAMTELVEEVYKIRSSDVTVLVTGESGTGKELVSRAIHTVSNRKDKVFVPFNCTAVPKELAEGHLFGYKKGAFTGAAQDSPGTIRTADGGTLFLDEIGDLPLDVQPKLLRFLQEGEVQPLGEKKPIKVDVRIIAATNMDLEKRVAEGLFREDLFYRLNVIRLRVPPLRERRSEIEPIVNYYVNHYSSRFNKKDISITPQTIDLLMVCDWVGNVRQLCNEVQRIVARAEDGELITPDHLSPELKRTASPIAPVEGSNVTPIMAQAPAGGAYTIGSSGATLEEAVAELERQMIIDSLRRNEDNISKVARELGLTRRGLYLKIKRYEIDRKQIA